MTVCRSSELWDDVEPAVGAVSDPVDQKNRRAAAREDERASVAVDRAKVSAVEAWP